MKYVLVPTPVPEKLTLYEALMWVAFRMYFTEKYSAVLTESRQDSRYHFSLTLPKPFAIEVFFTEDNCKKYDLPKNYVTEWMLAELDGEEVIDPFDNEISWEEIRRFEESEDPWKREYADVLRQKRLLFDEFYSKQKPFDDAFEDYLEVPKSELFIALKKGNIKSVGREIPNNFKLKSKFLKLKSSKLPLAKLDTLPAPSKQDAPIDHSVADELPPLSKIPQERWMQKNINWDDSILQQKEAKYCHVLIDSQSLFAHFPEPEMSLANVYSHNGTLFVDKKNAPLNITKGTQRGRKPHYHAKEIHAEIIQRFLAGNVPRYQNAFIIQIQEWCEKKWGKEHVPSDAYLKGYTSPFYTAKKKSEIKEKKLARNS